MYTYKAKLDRVVDGDTIHLNSEKIWFTGIDPPELEQTCIKDGIKNSCGLIAKQILINKIGNNNVECIREGRDQYQRTLAECFVNDESLSSFLVKSVMLLLIENILKNSLKMRIMQELKKLVCGQWNLNIRGIIEGIIKVWMNFPYELYILEVYA